MYKTDIEVENTEELDEDYSWLFGRNSYDELPSICRGCPFAGGCTTCLED